MFSFFSAEFIVTIINFSKSKKRMILFFLSRGLLIFGVLLFSITAFAQDQVPVEFEADNVTIDQNEGILMATGNVTISQNGDTITADRVIYNQTSSVARALGNVRIITKEGIEHLADEMTLEENFTRAIAIPLITNFSDGTRFSANQGTYEQQKKTTFTKSIFSPCKCDYENGETPIWDLRTSNSVHDIETQTITHTNVSMHIFGLPIMYFPFLAHADESVKRRSGLLVPNATYSNDKGLTVSTPYYHVIDEVSDIEVQATNFQFRGQGLKTIYRQLWDQSELDATLYTAHVETFKEDREQVGAIDTNFHTKVGEGWDVEMRLFRTSQDTFPRRYRYFEERRLESYFKAEKLSENRYYLIRSSDTQGLKSTDTTEYEPTILPHIYYEKLSNGPFKNQTIRRELSALQLDNDEGYEIVRWTGLIGSHQRFRSDGHIFTLTGDAMGSYHDIQSTGNQQDKTTEVGQGNMIATGEWTYPLGLSYGSQNTSTAIISPKVKVTLINGTDRTDDIPNRDSSDFRLDEANMFLANRFQGRDFILPGGHIAAGLSGLTETPTFGDISGFIGLSYKASGKTPAGLTSSGRNNYSDYVASFSAQTPYDLTLSWAGRADSESFKLNESRLSTAYIRENTIIEISHNQLAEGYFTASKDDREEATIKIEQNLFNGITFKADQVWNLSSGQTKKDQSIISLSWAGGFQDCLTVSLDYKRDPYADRDIKKVSELQLLFSFKYLGSISQSDIGR